MYYIVHEIVCFYFVKMFLKMEFNKLNWTELNESWRATEDRWMQTIWISKLTFFFRDDYCGPQTYFEEGVCYIWSARFPLRNDMNFASIQNTFDSPGDYFKIKTARIWTT